jgi:drug/metabolite transporter (DMT)-like permease
MSLYHRVLATFSGLPGPFRAAFWIVCGGGAFVFMMAIARHLADDLHMLLIVFWRAVFGVAFMLPWLARRGLGALRTDKAALHGARTLSNYGGLLFTFYAATLLPLADITAIGFARPIIGSVLAILILGEAARARRWWATLAGFAGALIIVRPGFVEFNPGIWLVICAVVLGGFNVILARYLVRTDTPDTVAMYMMLFLTPMSLAPALFVWRWPDGGELLWLVLLGAVGMLSQRSITRAYHAAEATLTLSFDFLRLPVAALIGYVLFAERPDVWVWVGGAVICAATVFLGRLESRDGGAETR